VGDDAANDGDVIQQLSWLRARIEDFGNVATGQTLELVSRVDPDLTEMAVARTPDAPIIVDTDGDGVCDDVNPDLVPTTSITQPKQALLVVYNAIPVQGYADFRAALPALCTSNTDCPSTESCTLLTCTQNQAPCLTNSDCPTNEQCFGHCIYSDAVCPIIGGTAIPPHAICVGSPVFYDLGYLGTSKEPAIWNIPPTTDKALCQGLQFDSANKVPDGPLCVAVRARDRAGNRNVSRPLRVCLDHLDKGLCDATYYQQHNTQGNVAPNHATLPDCTGTVVNGKVDGTIRCKPGVKRNTGVVINPFPPQSTPYLVPG
jgi:hypothetical protein